MKIIIVGVGKVGKTLAEYLVNENHDIVIIDTNSELIEDLINKYDLNGITGSGANYDVLVEAGIKNADIIIATTEKDEINILSCLLGKKYGVKYAIARVRNPEYFNQTKFFNEELELDMVINPEYEAASEIARILKFPSAQTVDAFANNKVELVGFKLKDNSPLINNNLIEIRSKLKTKFLVCVVEREGKAVIPNGRFILKANDIVYVIAARTEILNLFKELGIFKNRAKNTMIIGGGVISYYLAKEILDANSKVKIIELDRSRCTELKELLPKANIIAGDGSDKDLLIEESINEVDAFVTLTGLDEENIILSLYAESLNISKVITKINKISYYDILKSLNLSSIISPKLITANNILRYVRSLQNAVDSKVETLYKLINNQVEALEFSITKESEITNIKLRDLNFKDDLLVGIILRQDKVIIPTGDDLILPQDKVIVVTTNQNISDLKITKS